MKIILVMFTVFFLVGCSIQKEPAIIVRWKIAECIPEEIIVGVPVEMTQRVEPLYNVCGINEEIALSKKSCRDALRQCNLQLDEIRSLGTTESGTKE